MKKYKCACCGYYTLIEEPLDSYEMCPVCYWAVDTVQNNDPTFWGGFNEMNLNEARENYKRIGAKSAEYLKYVRLPLDSEKEENQH